MNERFDREVKQGRTVFGVEIGIRDGDNKELPQDGKAFGDLVIADLGSLAHTTMDRLHPLTRSLLDRARRIDRGRPSGTRLNVRSKNMPTSRDGLSHSL